MKAVSISIIGGGIGGLAAAAALLKKGFEVQVYERARALRPIGAGLTLSPNGLNSLEAITPGTIEALKKAGSEVHSTTMKRSSGETFISRPITIAQQFGQPILNIQWSRLQSILASALPPGIINLNRRCVAVEQHEGGVKAVFENGAEAESDLLIGADGINSAVRQALIGDGAPAYAGRMSWLSVIKFSHEVLAPHAITGFTAMDGKNFMLFDLGDGYTFWSAGALSAEPSASGGADSMKDRVLGIYSGWAEPVEAIIRATPAADIVERPICDRSPVSQWSKGRVTLLGDAAHLVVPALGQGANMTFEDAYELAEFLSSSPDIKSALHAYEASRIPRTAKIYFRSAAQGLSFFKSDNEAALAKTVENLSEGEFQVWLYGYKPGPHRASPIGPQIAAKVPRHP